MEKTVESRMVYKGRIINLRLDSVSLSNGRIVLREVVEHPGAVGIVAVKENGDIVMVTQYRKAVEEVLLELPAGKLEKDEDPKECAARELEEETGYRASDMRYLMTFYTSPGFSNEVMHLFFATGLSRGEKNPDDDEVVDTVEISEKEAFDMVLSGRIRDGKTIAGILVLSHINDMT
ncbi:MAG: NUDIX hydrolase [Bacillota bacterium]|nr:NUDIX hydrolase [Bacillota bacterium]MDD3298274.1 NUDIX hydrolase [Bacillota bacterium]MDD4707807.1 NUDIX hydrolase [Bacillota bacterium]